MPPETNFRVDLMITNSNRVSAAVSSISGLITSLFQLILEKCSGEFHGPLDKGCY